MDDERRNNEKQTLLNFKPYLISHIEPHYCEGIAHRLKQDGVIEESDYDTIIRCEDNNKVDLIICSLLKHLKTGFFRSFLNSIPEGLSEVKAYVEGSNISTNQHIAELKYRIEVYCCVIVRKIKAKDILLHFPDILDDISRQEVLSRKTDIGQASRLLQLVVKREKSIPLFIEALKDESEQIMDFLEGNELLKKGIMEDETILCNKNSYNLLKIVESLEPNDVVDFLEIDDEKKNSIRALSSREERVDLLFKIFACDSEWHKKLLTALKQTDCQTDYCSVVGLLESMDSSEVEIEESEVVTENEHGPAPNMDVKGPAPNMDGKGPAPNMDGKGPAPNMDGKGPAPNMDIVTEESEAVTEGEKHPAPNMEENIELNILEADKDLNEPNNLSNEDNEIIETAEMKDLKFQVELAKPAVEGNNCVIVSETGTGKTFVAVRICREHISKNSDAKVVFLVHKVPLVTQQFNVFKKNLKLADVTIDSLWGEKLAKTPVAEVMKENKVVIMTHDVLKNILRSKDFQLEKISLLFFDECHNTMKNHPYRAIMEIYFDQKRKGSQVPQIVGLTATPGSGNARGTSEACRHIQTLLSYLDVVIPPVTVTENTEELAQYVSEGSFETVPVKRNPKDKFAAILIKLMMEIEGQIKDKLEKNENCTNGLQYKINAAYGSQAYEGSIVGFGKEVLLKIKHAKMLRMELTLRTDHLRMYNDALLVNDHLRPSNAVDFIDEEMNKDCSENLTTKSLKELYNNSEIHNCDVTTQGSPLLIELTRLLHHHFMMKPDSRCIVFVKTRAIAMHLANCLNQAPQLNRFNLNATYLTGSGVSKLEGGLTKNQQDSCLSSFRKGDSKVIASTTIADEGIDIKACNLVVTYNHATNEITEVQRKGRGRARDSQMVVLCYEDSKFLTDHKLNKKRQELVKQSLEIFKHEDKENFMKQVRKLQSEEALKLSTVTRQHVGGVWILLCKKCGEYVTSSEHIWKIKDAHHVVVDDEFHGKFEVIPYDEVEMFDDLRAVGDVKCKKPVCRRPWGREIIYKERKHQIVSAKNFIFEKGEKRELPKKWCLAPSKVEKSFDDYLYDHSSDEAES